jgi:ATP-dependent DNA helicase RecQ
LILTLLRTYEGIFDYPTFISEKALANLLRLDESDIKKTLHDIDRYHIIEYKPQNDTPQIIFRKQRVPVEDLKVNLTLYNKRKEAFIMRVEKMIGYTEAKSCRSAFINAYFGGETPSCGVCDNCLAKKNTALTTEEFEQISTRLLQMLAQPQKAETLMDSFTSKQKEKAWEVLLFLQAEGNVMTDAGGRLHLKKAPATAPPASGTTQP